MERRYSLHDSVAFSPDPLAATRVAIRLHMLASGIQKHSSRVSVFTIIYGSWCDASSSGMHSLIVHSNSEMSIVLVAVMNPRNSRRRFVRYNTPGETKELRRRGLSCLTRI